MHNGNSSHSNHQPCTDFRIARCTQPRLRAALRFPPTQPEAPAQLTRLKEKNSSSAVEASQSQGAVGFMFSAVIEMGNRLNEKMDKLLSL